MTLEQLYRELLPMVSVTPDKEVCGLLFGPFQAIPTTVTSLDVVGMLPVKNIAPTPETTFEIDHEIVREQWRLRRGDLLGIYHSHLTGPAIASQADRDMVEQTGLISVIIAPGRELRVYGRHLGQVIEIGAYRLNMGERP